MLFHSLRMGAIAAIAALGLVSCAPVAQNTPQSLAQERQAAAEFVRRLDAKGQLVNDPALTSYLNGVATRVSAARPPGSVPIRAYIVKDADVNAFTPGGGYVFFNAGMLAAMENEAQLAAVMAHEIAHIDRGHIQAGRSNRTAVQLGAALATIGAAAAGLDPRVTELGVGLVGNYAVNSFSRTQESDADDVGVRYLAASGYNAVEGAKSFAVLQRLYGGNRNGIGAAFFASHPAPADRLAKMTAQARALGAGRGRIGERTHDRATRKLRQDVLRFYEANGRRREAAQIRRNLR